MMITAADIREKTAQVTAADAFFELEELTIEGHSYPVYKHAAGTLTEVIQNGRNHGDIDFMVYEGRRYTYNRFFEEVDALAATLIGAIVVPVNSWGKTEELQYALTDSKSRILVCDAARFKLIADILGEIDLDILLVDGEAGADRVLDFNVAVQRGRGQWYAVADVTPEDACVILYTSGSTGFPKGVVHRHVAACQSLMNMFFYGMLLMELEGAREFKGGAERETPMLTVPLFHATGLLSGLLMPLQMGHKTVMMYKWDTLQALKLIEQEKITGLTSVPAVLMELFNHPEFDNHDTSSLIRIAAAGAATPAGLPELIREKAGEPSRSTGWGMTETMAVGTVMSGAVYDLHPESAGIPSPIVNLRFVDADGQVLSEGEAGEIEVRSIVCTPGYWQKPEANESTFMADRWMKTGDLARIDEDGYLHITGRIKEIVIRGGENIYPGEIEQAVYKLAQVQENVVFGVEDAAMGEELAMVAYSAKGDLSEDALRAFLKEHLAGYKVPRYIQISDHPLPQNASGKLHKLKVKEQFRV